MHIQSTGKPVFSELSGTTTEELKRTDLSVSKDTIASATDSNPPESGSQFVAKLRNFVSALFQPVRWVYEKLCSLFTSVKERVLRLFGKESVASDGVGAKKDSYLKEFESARKLFDGKLGETAWKKCCDELPKEALNLLAREEITRHAKEKGIDPDFSEAQIEKTRNEILNFFTLSKEARDQMAVHIRANLDVLIKAQS